MEPIMLCLRNAALVLSCTFPSEPTAGFDMGRFGDMPSLEAVVAQPPIPVVKPVIPVQTKRKRKEEPKRRDEVKAVPLPLDSSSKELPYVASQPRTLKDLFLPKKSYKNMVQLADGNEDLKCLSASPRLQGIVEAVYKRWKKPVVIESGYRSKKHNAKVSGAKASMHMHCSKGNGAIDFIVRGVDPLTLCRFVKSLPQTGGYGIYNSNFIHVDTGARRHWDWRSKKNRKGSC